MRVPARCWPARSSRASGKPGRPCPTCRLKTSRFRTQATSRLRTPSKTSDLRGEPPSRQRSRHRSRPVAQSPSQSHRVLAVAPPVRSRTARAREHPELLARLKARRAARALGPPRLGLGRPSRPDTAPQAEHQTLSRSSPAGSQQGDRRHDVHSAGGWLSVSRSLPRSSFCASGTREAAAGGRGGRSRAKPRRVSLEGRGPRRRGPRVSDRSFAGPASLA